MQLKRSETQIDYDYIRELERKFAAHQLEADQSRARK
jgi:hypothetical protein